MRVTDARWIQNGQWRLALVSALKRPITGNELHTAMRATQAAKKIRLHDISLLLRQFEARKIVICLTPRETSGRVFYLTEKGRRLRRKLFQTPVPALPHGVNWTKYSYLIRAPVRRLALFEMADVPLGQSKLKTPTTLRKAMDDKHPLCLADAIRVMNKLEELKLVERADITDKNGRALFQITPSGLRLAQLLKSVTNTG